MLTPIHRGLGLNPPEHVEPCRPAQLGREIETFIPNWRAL